MYTCPAAPKQGLLVPHGTSVVNSRLDQQTHEEPRQSLGSDLMVLDLLYSCMTMVAPFYWLKVSQCLMQLIKDNLDAQAPLL